MRGARAYLPAAATGGGGGGPLTLKGAVSGGLKSIPFPAKAAAAANAAEISG